MSDPVDELNRILAEAISSSKELYYVCFVCGETFDSGRRARKHALNEHDDISAVRRREYGSGEGQ